MSKRIRVTVNGVQATADLDGEAAPETVARIWDALPIEGNLRHLRWGGEGAYILVRELADPSLAIEDPVTFYPPGSLAFRPAHGEFVIPYGQAQARSHLISAAFATRIGRLTDNVDRLLREAQGTLNDGGKPIRIERWEA